MKINPVSSEFQVHRTVVSTDPVPAADQIQRTGREPEAGAQEGAPREVLERAVEKLNQATDLVDKRLRFSLHEESERMQVFVIDNQTQEVIKEIPPEEVLNIVARIQEMVGLLLDERV